MDDSTSHIDHLSELKSRVKSLRAQLAEAEADLVRASGGTSSLDGDLYRELVESMPEMIYTLSPEGRITYANPHFLNWLGYTSEEVLGGYFGDFLDQDVRSEIESFYLQQVASGTVFSYREFRIRNKAGELMWVGQNVVCKFEMQRLHKVVVSARDITEQLRLRKLLHRSEEKYRGIIENMELGLMEVDAEGNILWINRSFSRLSEYTLDEVFGKNAVELFLPDEFQDTMNEEVGRREHGQTGFYEIQIRRKSGELRNVVISGAPVTNEDGEVTGSIGIHFDVTDSRKTEAELKVAREKAERARLAEKEFLASMSHEIRTPLNAVIGMSHLLSETQLSTEQEQLLTSIYYSANLLHGLINDVLDFSKIEAGELVVKEAEVDVTKQLRACLQMIGYGLMKPEVELRMNVLGAVPEKLVTDPVMLTQIVTNLLGNAVKFTNAGSVELNLGAKELDGHWEVMVQVTDTGVGIPEDKLEEIFEKFKQVGKQGNGTGLGLAITKRITESLGGTIHVESQVGVGSQFTLRIPMSVPDVVAHIGPSATSELNALSTVLVVDDNEMNISYITKLLRKWGVHFECARDGLEAWQLSKQTAYSMIFMDVQMPRMNGLEATSKIRADKSNPNFDVPIIGLSAYAFEEDVRLSARAGMSGYLTKPYSPDELAAVFNRFASVELASKQLSSSGGRLRFDDLMEELYENDLGYAKDMFGIYLEQFPEYVSDIVNARENADPVGLANALHKCRPPMQMVGLKDLSEVSERIENLIKTDGFSEATDQLLEDFLTSVKSHEEEVRNEYERMTNLLGQR